VAEDSKKIEYGRLVGKVSVRLIPFMLVLYVVSYLDRINISFASLQMNSALHISDKAYGIGSGIFFFGYCLFGIPSNLLIEKIGPRRWTSLIMVVWGLITVAMCLLRNETEFYILRFILGVAEAGFFPGMILYLTYWFSPKYYSSAVARFMSAIPLAGLLGSGIASWALGITAFGLAGWKWLFIATGLPAVLLGIVVWFFLPDRPRDAKWLTREESECVEASASATGTVSEATDSTEVNDSAGKRFFSAVRDLTVWRFAFLYFTLTTSMYGFQLWLPQIIKAFGSLDDQVTAMVAAIPALLQALGMLIVAGNSDRTGERRYHVVAAAVSTCSGLAIACVGGEPWIKLVGLCLAAFGIWGSVGPFWALTTNNLSARSKATGIAIVNSVGNLGGFAGPSIVGLIKQYSHGFDDSLIALAVASVLAGVLAATSPKSRSV
jgi:ACS family tartrate transporter-like MFS transporter